MARVPDKRALASADPGPSATNCEAQYDLEKQLGSLCVGCMAEWVRAGDRWVPGREDREPARIPARHIIHLNSCTRLFAADLAPQGQAS